MANDDVEFNPDDLNGTADRLDSLASDLEKAHTDNIDGVRKAVHEDVTSFTKPNTVSPCYEDVEKQVNATCDHIDQTMTAIIGNLRNDAKFLREVAHAHSTTEDRSKINFDKLTVPDAPSRTT